ncbi:MAG: TIGR00282 family metallophosphoesterase [Clostridia bacterium]|nr:TIGR00282 family metallophosphoesterase [Clostridia bacterium]
MRVLMVGDIVGRPGRQAVQKYLPLVIEEYKVDFVIANGENAAGGNGLTRSVANELFAAGIDVLTTGNHVWDKKEIFQFIDLETRVVRPANYPPGTPGKGYVLDHLPDGRKIAVINLSGRVFMPDLDCPFRAVEYILPMIQGETVNIVVDFHAEATSEKKAFGYFVDGQVSAVFGTHTHVQTADEKILPKGTAYITDVGMTGPEESVLGIDPEIVIRKFITQLPVKFQLAGGPLQFNGVVIDINTTNGLCKSVERVNTILER